ncbi:MAG: hypothetical protein LUQ65_04140 [Candidatus Helarchaeota archaeon]|nr:hypothetical protein [Candidatus Helarchaeota archaeon]
MAEEKKYHENSPAVQAHLNMMQSVIQRMSTNSASCKAWCLTLVSAILVIIADKDKPQYALIAIIPTVLFLVLDTYYLALERMLRQTYNIFIDKLHDEKVLASDLYALAPTGKLFNTFFSSTLSFSIWPFYVTLLATIWIVKSVLN